MNSLNDEVIRKVTTGNEVSAMEIEQLKDDAEEEEQDPFLQFIEYAKSILSSSNGNGGDEDEFMNCPSWGWIVSRILRTCIAYSSGVTSGILLSELSQAWSELNRGGAPKRQPELISKLKKKHKRAKLPNLVTIDSIYEKKFLSLNSVIEAVIIDAFILPGTNIYILSLGDFWSSNTIDLYLHRRFYSIADPNNGILKKGREVFLTGCYLRTTTGSSGHIRLLPTEYFVVLLDEDEDDDAMLLGAQFCSDSFSSISLNAVREGTSYSLYAKIEYIGPMEVLGEHGSLKRKQVTLVDNDGVRLKFLLWGEQILLANLFSVGSMLALDRPFIACGADSCLDSGDEICLEYGSATQLYLVPFIQHKEQVSVVLTQSYYQGSRHLSSSDQSQGPTVSQVTLPCDSQGSIDFSNYPFRPLVVDLRDKMTSISLYGTVVDIKSSRKDIISLTIEDATGTVWVNLHLVRPWPLGRLGRGHTVYVTGLSSSMAKGKRLELSWFEDEPKASFINISCLPALLNSSCLRKLVRLSDLSTQARNTCVCRVWLDQIEHCHVNTRLSHALCGHFVDETPAGDLECNFCHAVCTSEVVRAFHLKMTLADESAKIFAWCTGQTAAELLQISADEFSQLPEEEQIMYPSSLEHERFIVAIVNCRRHYYKYMEQEHDAINWEVTRAIKSE